MDVNQLIGARLKAEVGRGKAASSFRRAMVESLGEEWNDQTYHDAVSGRRIFRVSELIGLARAAGVHAYDLLDAAKAGAGEVTISRRTERAAPVTLSAMELVDLFKAPTPEEGPTWRAFLANRHAIRELGGLLREATKVDAELSRRYPIFPAFEE